MWISAGQSPELDEEGVDIDTKSIIQNLYLDVYRDNHSQDSTDKCDEESVQHKLGFRCTSTAHEKSHQEFLKNAETKLHKELVPIMVRLRPEPTNERQKCCSDWHGLWHWLELSWLHCSEALTLIFDWYNCL